MMREAPSRVERLADPLPPPGAVGTAAASRARGWAVSLVSPAAVAPREAWFLGFRNYYAASARVELVLADGQTAALASDALPLMRCLHAEDDAQNWHLVELRPAVSGATRFLTELKPTLTLVDACVRDSSSRGGRS